jgi:serine/threonine protein phosphatase PrpC
MDHQVSLSWHGTGFTDTGLARQTNQDAFAVDNDLGLWLVADGMGGHAGGGIASRIAVDSLIGTIRAVASAGGALSIQPSQAVELLTEAIAIAHEAIHQAALQKQELEGMGTTIVACLLCPGAPSQAVVAHVGDSRAYLLRNRLLHSLTNDHSYVQKLVAQGDLTEDEASRHPQRNILLRALGIPGQSIPDTKIQPLEPDDELLLCTDGLTKMLGEEEILSLLSDTQVSPTDMSRRLVERANENGGKDNTTVVLIRPNRSIPAG